MIILRNGLSVRHTVNFLMSQCQKIPSSSNLVLLSTSAHHNMSLKGNVKKPDGALNKYKNFFEINFPTLYAIQRQIFDGCKCCISDLKMYYALRKSQKIDKKNIEDFNRKELECLIKTSSNLSKILIVSVIAVLPFTIYPLALAIIFLPRLTVTHHFWSKKNYKNFLSTNLALKLNFHYHPLLSAIEINQSFSLPLNFRDIKKDFISIPKLEEIDIIQMCHLLRFHQVSLFNGAKNLKERSFLIYCLDKKLREKLDFNIDNMSEEEVVMQLYMRKIYFKNTDDIKVLKKKLKDWLKYSEKFYIKGNESFLLYVPILEKGSNC
uniref:Letm1 RBD domain-containing protein n=2 Tax=Strongyloides stercoralis TaxID=6248 RepID=A0AAF5DBB7_STRER